MKMKKFFCVIVLFFSCYVGFAQLAAYEDYKYKMNIIFDINFNTEDAGYFIVAITSDTELNSRIIPKEYEENIESHLMQSFEYAACNSCELLFKEKTSKPIDFMYSEIELHRVFLISKEAGDFYVEVYGKE